MPSAENYRALAADMAAKARKEKHPTMRAQYEALELGYLRLAIQAEKNAGTDIAYETPRNHPSIHRQHPPKKEPEE
jgi:hypothetical protein